MFLFKQADSTTPTLRRFAHLNLDQPELQVPGLLATGIDPQFIFQQLLIFNHHEAATYMYSHYPDLRETFTDRDALLSVEAIQDSISADLLPDDYRQRIDSGLDFVYDAAVPEALVDEARDGARSDAASAGQPDMVPGPRPRPASMNPSATEGDADDREPLGEPVTTDLLRNIPRSHPVRSASATSGVAPSDAASVPVPRPRPDRQDSRQLETTSVTVESVDERGAREEPEETATRPSRRFYSIQPGDTLSKLAREWGLDNYTDIYEFAENKQKIGGNPDRIRVGDHIEIPPEATVPAEDIVVEILPPPPVTTGERTITVTPPPDYDVELAKVRTALELFSIAGQFNGAYDDREAVEALYESLGLDPADIELTNAGATPMRGSHQFLRGDEFDRALIRFTEATEGGLNNETLDELREIALEIDLTIDTAAIDDVIGELPSQEVRDETQVRLVQNISPPRR